MGIIIDNSVKNMSNVSSIKSGNIADLNGLRRHLFIAKDTNQLFYRDEKGQLHLLTGNGGGGSGEEYEVVTYDEDGTYTVPLGYRLREVILIPAIDSLITIGSTPGGNEYYSDQVTAVDGEVLNLVTFSLSASKTLYFTGITSTTYIVFFKTLITISTFAP